MKDKPLWKSKTIWAAVGAIVAAAGGWATGELTPFQAVVAAMGALGGYGLRDAMRDK